MFSRFISDESDPHIFWIGDIVDLREGQFCVGRCLAVVEFLLPGQYRSTQFQWRTQEFCSWGGQQIQLRTERTGIWGRSPLIKGSGGSCNLVQEISFHIVKFS